MTGFVPVMWTVWGVLVLFLLALYLYQSRLTRDEDDQIVLDDSFDRVKTEQAAIVEKVKKIEPLVRLAIWLAGAATLVVIGYYIVDFIKQFK
jgi:nucleoside recognition membrane protein YjiH